MTSNDDTEQPGATANGRLMETLALVSALLAERERLTRDNKGLRLAVVELQGEVDDLTDALEEVHGEELAEGLRDTYE